MEIQNVSGVGSVQGRIQSDRPAVSSEPAPVVPQQEGSPNQLPDPESFNLDIYA